MFFLLFVCSVAIFPARAFLSVAPLGDCPNAPPQAGVKISQVTGSWRLAYLFVDENDELEEDNTCAVTEIVQVNETQLELLLYVDARKDEITLDRYTKEFDITVLTPGEWLLHTAFADLEFIHVTVISSSDNHLILTFCANPFAPENEPQVPNQDNDYDSFLNNIDRDSMDDIFKAKSYSNMFRDVDDYNGRLVRQRRVRRPSRLLRGKRFSKAHEDLLPEESVHDKVVKYIRANKLVTKPKKHLWTAILVKDNNISALKFVENASLLMKYGFKLTSGQLVSFGGCSLSKK